MVLSEMESCSALSKFTFLSSDMVRWHSRPVLYLSLIPYSITLVASRKGRTEARLFPQQAGLHFVFLFVSKFLAAPFLRMMTIERQYERPYFSNNCGSHANGVFAIVRLQLVA